MGWLEEDISPEKPLGVCPSVSSTSDGERAGCGRMCYWSTARKLELSYSQMGGGWRRELKAMHLKSGGTRQGRDRNRSLSPVAPPQHPYLWVLLLWLPHSAVWGLPVWAWAPKLPLASGGP